MATAPETTLDVTKMTRTQKLAALLVLLGPETAGQILKDLDETQVAAVTAAMTTLPNLTDDVQRGIIDEFSRVAVDAVTAVRGSVEIAQIALEKAVGSSRANEILDRVAPGRSTKSAMQIFVEKEPQQIFNALRDEQPQAIAIAISHLPPKKAGTVLRMFPEETCHAVVERIALLVPLPVEVVETMGKLFLKRVGTTETRTFSKVGGLQPVATVLNAMPRDHSKALLTALETRNPELHTAIRNQMFTFADLVRLDVAALQKVLREVDSGALAVALKSADEQLKAHLLSGLSKRAAESVKEEISFLGKIKPQEIEAAQKGIIEVVRRLESSGDIEIVREEAEEHA